MSDSWVAVVVAFYSAGLYILLRDHSAQSHTGSSLRILIWGGSLGTALLWHCVLIATAISTWSNDSFHTLTVSQQAGLATVSVLLIAILFWLSGIKTDWVYKLSETRDIPFVYACLVDISITYFLFVFFYGISPQIYYIYYQLIIPSLPNQWVVSSAFQFEPALQRLFMRPISSYGDLLAALTFWTLLFSVIWRYLLIWTQRKSWVYPALVGTGFGMMCLGWVLTD